MKKFKVIFFVFTVAIFNQIFLNSIKAVSFEYPKYNVDITINQDSTLNITEDVVYRVFGDFHGLRRDLTLADPLRDSKCKSQNNIYCGGFDRININRVLDLNGNDITNKINLYKVSEDSGLESLRIEWEIFKDGEYQNGDLFGWKIEYTIYGSIFPVENNPYFYWNLLPEKKNGIVESSIINIKFPSSSTLNLNRLQEFISLDYKKNKGVVGNTLTYKFSDLPSYAPITIAYQFNSTEIDLPGQISYSISPAFGYSVFLDNVNITDQVDGLIKGVSEGKRILRFEHIGYATLTQEVFVESNETKFLDVNLKPLPWMQVLILINNLICLCGVILIPIFLFFVYWHYKRKGKDKEMPKTIIPLFSPPKDFAPYLAGSLIDESVDKKDIVGSIIDLGYRGFIKIKEIKKNKNYLLTKSRSDVIGLNKIEMELLNAIFKSSDSVETKDLGKTFVVDFVSLKNNIYKEMVDLKYFNRSPVTTIGIYFSLGCFTFILGVIAFFAITFFLIYFLGVLTFFTPAVALILVGFSFMAISKYMPAKTSTGSKLYAEVLGFKMYMQTAEKYTVQNLNPEDFVKYLSYAIVFGIEKEWGKKFEGIYKGVPDWYQGSGDIYDAIWLSNFANSFTNSTVSNLTPVSSGSSKGSGWSGGGSFGGFSGGGGGGGSSGGW